MYTFPDIYNMMVKERASGMYRLSAHYLALTTANLPIDLLMPFLFIIPAYWMTYLRQSAAAFFLNWISFVLGQLTAQVRLFAVLPEDKASHPFFRAWASCLVP